MRGVATIALVIITTNTGNFQFRKVYLKMSSERGNSLSSDTAGRARLPSRLQGLLPAQHPDQGCPLPHLLLGKTPSCSDTGSHSQDSGQGPLFPETDA